MNLPKPPLRVLAFIEGDVKRDSLSRIQWWIRGAASVWIPAFCADSDRFFLLDKDLTVIPHDKNDQEALDIIAVAKTNAKGE